MARLYADENFNYTVTVELRRLGHDVRTVQDAGRRGEVDPTVLSDATADGRAVITHNRFDFVRLHRRPIAHAGIIVCTDDPDAVALATGIHNAVAVPGSLLRCLI